ncbi:exosortase A-associated hydrolase 1 [Inhella inkyongensis]|uniref:Exosortase A-associated hydrolase 1 n=1 Tax=Inhella inkyongensis TaxID=392593 RepID=A0A840S4P1_9BURK|nr:hydrolase 1, exosortase A system-associated [Inhella inkyongensis]MBB5204006.1 exosortase A-associated hydrolase 1 [Inhella inkyongensis]
MSADRIISLGDGSTQRFGLLSPGTASVGVVVLVGGPQYRAGSHRHFVQLARFLAQAGTPCLRFDHAGIGDSSGNNPGNNAGALPDFCALDAEVDLAISALMQAQPQLQGVVLWGLCDGASAALLYMARRNDPRVRGLCLLNPWVRSAQGEARARVQHYYWERLRNPEFWRKLLGGGVGLGALKGWWAARQLARQAAPATPSGATQCYQMQMAQGYQAFAGPRLVQLSGRDHTAREFEAAGELFPLWRNWQSHAGLTLQHYPEADHTFSRRALQQQSFEDLLSWLHSHWPQEARA